MFKLVVKVVMKLLVVQILVVVANVQTLLLKTRVGGVAEKTNLVKLLKAWGFAKSSNQYIDLFWAAFHFLFGPCGAYRKHYIS